jgi:hypothetical protein
MEDEMATFALKYEYEESIANNQAIGLYITVWFHDTQMKYILDVDEFFKAMETPGISPLFTCSCGGFGCGGYFVKVIHDQTGVIFKNSYKPEGTLDDSNLIDRFEFAVPWGDIKRMSEKILEIIAEIISKWPGYLIFSGSYSDLDLTGWITDYQRIMGKLKV